MSDTRCTRSEGEVGIRESVGSAGRLAGQGAGRN